MARTGYTLPVFAVAAAQAALLHLQKKMNSEPVVTLNLLRSAQAEGLCSESNSEPRKPRLPFKGGDGSLPESADIPIQQLASLDATTALAITISDPGDNLDLTRHTPIWALVRLSDRTSDTLILEAGEGVGKTVTGNPAIYSYARRLFDANLLPLIPSDQTVKVTIILPFGRQLAQRTSNEAFGILEGLSLLGTSGISQPLSAADHLEAFRLDLQNKVKIHSNLVFCLGSSGMQVAQRLGIPEMAVVQTGNWLGAMLVEAGLNGANSILLLGYQGKLIKLAGGIFNTSSHLADAKLEIISAAVASVGGDMQTIQAILTAKTADTAYKHLVQLQLAESVFTLLAEKISQKAIAYVQKYGDVSLTIGTILCDRQGQIVSRDTNGSELLKLFI
jgi:cobalt-precorrin-5B (C1)-methyltransferase